LFHLHHHSFIFSFLHLKHIMNHFYYFIYNHLLFLQILHLQIFFLKFRTFFWFNLSFYSKLFSFRINLLIENNLVLILIVIDIRNHIFRPYFTILFSFFIFIIHCKISSLLRNSFLNDFQICLLFDLIFIFRTFQFLSNNP